jgi:hypothetical protein
MAEERDQARQSRLRAALRENLKRRKQQLRGRADRGAPADDDPAAVPDEADGRARSDRGDRE